MPQACGLCGPFCVRRSSLSRVSAVTFSTARVTLGRQRPNRNAKPGATEALELLGIASTPAAL